MGGGSIRTIAVDWSGAAKDARRKIWLAEIRDGHPTCLENGRTRREVVDHLVEAAAEAPDLVVGLDFAFSLPAWFLEERGLASARELWARVEAEGEDWLQRCDPPFWRVSHGTSRPDLSGRARFRRTEQWIRESEGFSPKSVFQLDGPGAVGSASLRGMPHLLRLSQAGFSIWPFQEPSLPLVVEIYPRLLTGDVNKSDGEARREFLTREYPDLPGPWRDRAERSADAFDAAVSALVMDSCAEEFRRLEPASGSTVQVEGLIWRPGRSGTSRDGLEDAVVYAARLHADQRRKGPDATPYIAHLLGVCSLVLEAGGDEEQAIAALLHDAAEDQGGREQLREIGSRVADIVEACTDAFEDPKPEWLPRKKEFVASLEEMSPGALLVICADKLHNTRAILQDYRRVGDRVFDCFTGGKEGTLWYYRALADALRRSELESWLIAELKRTVRALEEAVG